MKKSIASLLTMGALSAMLAVAATGCAGTGKAEGTTAGTTAAGQSTAEKKENEASTTDGKGKKAVYLVNGSLGDKGFFDSAAKGMDLVHKDLGWETKIVEMGRDETSYESNFLDAADQDWDLIVAGTFSVREQIEETSAKYPEKTFLAFDCAINRDVATEGNVLGITYNSNEASYLAGVMAAKMLDSGDAKIDASKRVLGFVGSMDSANINDFLVGYIEGVKSVDPSIRVLTSYVGSFEDVPKCLEMTTQLYNQGAQMVYAPASQSILGAATAAKNCDKYLIACDQDLYTQLKTDQADLAANIITSTLKNVGESIETAVKGLESGEMNGTQDYVMGLKSGAVGLAENENYEKLVSEDAKKAVEDAKKKILDGEIKVDRAVDMKTEDVAALRDSMK